MVYKDLAVTSKVPISEYRRVWIEYDPRWYAG